MCRVWKLRWYTCRTHMQNFKEIWTRSLGGAITLTLEPYLQGSPFSRLTQPPWSLLHCIETLATGILHLMWHNVCNSFNIMCVSSGSSYPQAYTCKRRILIQVLPPQSNLLCHELIWFLQLRMFHISILLCHALEMILADLAYALGGGSTWMSIHLLQV